MTSRNPIAWCAIDTLCCLLLVIYTLVAPQTPKHPPSIPTFGSYAITLSWQGKDDIDLHVVDPKGNDAYFASPSTREMNLEHDFIPDYDFSGTTVWTERTIIRETQKGEYIVNAHFYDHPGYAVAKRVKVTVTLYRLRGNDRKLFAVSFYLDRQGQEHTAFRFTLNRAGDITSHNQLQRNIINGEDVYQ